jgi:uncharacterized protein with von Willebrand factor type A (vWA) domain
VSERLGLRVTGRLALLTAAMRASGARVGVEELLRAHRALAAVGADDRRGAYFALRAVLCSRREDVEAFEVAFAEWIAEVAPASDRSGEPETLGEIASLVLPRVAVPADERPVAPAGASLDPLPAAWSDVELLREKDFAEYTEAERRRARRLMVALAGSGPKRRSRRMRPARRGERPAGARPDLRRTMRSSLRYEGDPVERHWRRPGERPRPLVLVCDVSGSMEPYARMLLQYMQACVSARRRVEAFVFGTKLTRVTAELRGRDQDAALDRAAARVGDWSGGTRIGASLATLNRAHGSRVGRGAIVVLLSDGWDRGDPGLLGSELARLGRCAHRLIWLNPLKAHPDYEPLTRGMKAALPHVDHFLAGNSLASLEQLAALMQEGVE